MIGGIEMEDMSEYINKTNIFKYFKIIDNKNLKLIFLLFFQCVFFINCISDKNDSVFQENALREYSIIINEKNEFQKKRFDYNGYSSEGGHFFAYYNKSNNLVFIELFIFGERGRAEYNILPLNDNNFFIIETEYSYNKSIFEDVVGDYEIIKTVEKKYLIQDKKNYDITNETVVINDSYLEELIDDIFYEINLSDH
jgi:hypothetical protein